MKSLELKGISKSFGGLVAVNDLAIDLEDESMCGLIGPNGSGKTTLFNVISGFLKPDKGSVIFNGMNITGLTPHEIFRRGIYRTFQSPQIVSRLSVLENVLLASRGQVGEELLAAFMKRKEWHEKETQLIEKAYENLRFLGIERAANESPGTLSGGQLKLLEVARALMSDAELLLLDEPAAGVNPTLAANILDFLEHVRKDRGATVFVIEHKMELLLSRVSHVFVMNKGRLLFQGSPKEITEEPAVVEAYLGA